MEHEILVTSTLRYIRGAPLESYRLWCEQNSEPNQLLLVEFSFTAYWLADRPSLGLTALYLNSKDGLYISVTDTNLQEAAATSSLAPQEQYIRWSETFGFVRYCQTTPIKLEPRFIAKPWGQEIWYTGVEERGVCRFIDGECSTPIPWLQAAVPNNALGLAGEDLVLLKILDPVAQAVTGDLYFELHEEKQEVYVVTHVDQTAWQDGVGYIRMGFDPVKLEAFGGDQEGFRASYQQSVVQYEGVRRALDQLPAGEQAPPDLQSSEVELRRNMDSYSQLLPLKIGDVIKVPLLTPHSLQHGVRTIEFQTPVYERKILSFAQKVLTQDHWDTAEAVAKMRLDTQPPENFKQLRQGQGITEERIVDFDDFEVRRLVLSPAAGADLASMERYGLIMIVEGELAVDGQVYGPEQALILPRNWCGRLTAVQPASDVVFLLALPRD